MWKILYDDGDVEILRLEKERWELIDKGRKSIKVSGFLYCSSFLWNISTFSIPNKISVTIKNWISDAFFLISFQKLKLSSLEA